MSAIPPRILLLPFLWVRSHTLLFRRWRVKVLCASLCHQRCALMLYIRCLEILGWQSGQCYQSFDAIQAIATYLDRFILTASVGQWYECFCIIIRSIGGFIASISTICSVKGAIRPGTHNARWLIQYVHMYTCFQGLNQVHCSTLASVVYIESSLAYCQKAFCGTPRICPMYFVCSVPKETCVAQ